MILEKDNFQLVYEIINGMTDWVRVIDRNDTIVFANQAMQTGLGRNPVGVKCFMALGKDSPCENCISRRAVFEGKSYSKEETINGRTYYVSSSPVIHSDGEIHAVVEVLRDMTDMLSMQHKILEQNNKLNADLSIARKLQCSLLPQNLPTENIRFSFVYKPCETLGGDFIDMFRIDEDRYGIYIADVSGHGVPASMLTVFLRSTINKSLSSPAQALTQLYNEFNRNNFDHDLYITVFYGIINTKKMEIIYSNAGHNTAPVIFAENRFIALRTPGIPISDWMESPAYIDSATPLLKNDRIFFYTDGIVEIRNSENQQFGEERLLDILQNDPREPQLVLDNLVAAAYKFMGNENNCQMQDDMTVALVEIL